MSRPAAGPLPLLLLILDGWGVREECDWNAVVAANPVNIDRFAARFPTLRLLASGGSVGLPDGQIGNSEVGHLTIGAGRIVDQLLVRIGKAAETGALEQLPAFQAALAPARDGDGALHLIGLVSDGGVHSHQEHLEVIARVAARSGVRRLYVHAFLDGRDVLPQSALGYLAKLEKLLAETGVGKIATVGGRFWGMDRDSNWDRVEVAWQALVHGRGERARSAEEAVRRAYGRGEVDEFVKPTVVAPEGQEPPEGSIRTGDSVLCFNFRADRVRQITRALTEDGFDAFPVPDRPRLARYTCMAQYDRRFSLPILFPPEQPSQVLPEILSGAGLAQLRVAETEKYAHVTYFLNGGREQVFPGEERTLIPSKKMPSYAALPEMQAEKVLEAALGGLSHDPGRFFVVNFANPDMVGHSGDFEAATLACRTVDRCVGRLVDAVLERGGAALVTADHGNAEMMVDPETGSPHTAHTTNPVPCILACEELRGVRVPEEGALYDIAPSLLKLLGMQPPEEMNGRPLFD